MQTNETYDHAKFVIGRFDHYNDSVNSKGAFYIGLNTFLLGGVFVGFNALYKEMDIPAVLWLLLITFAICSVASAVLTIVAINPFLDSGNEATAKNSLIFFGSVARHQQQNFVHDFTNQDEHRKLSDTLNQAWMLSQGLKSKYKKLRVAGWMLIIQFGLLIPIIYLTTTKLIS
jgi:hypothetical protein